MTLTNRSKSLFINGEWQVASGTELAIFNPEQNAAFAIVKGANAEDVRQAAKSAAAAFPSWRATSGSMRAKYLSAIARGLEKRQDALISLQMQNNGKPRIEAEIDVGDAVATFDYYASLARGLDAAQDVRVDHAGAEHFGLVRHEPVGPVGMIVPWNFPLVTAAWKLGPALAAGCTAVLKSSEVTPFADLVYGDIAQEIGLPQGVLNLLTGDAEAGIALTNAPEFRKISFTGSNMVGSKVMQAVSHRCLPVALELGGKSPIVITADADIDQAVDCIMGGVFFNAGQICSATSRLIVDRSIEGDLMDALVAKTRALAVGPDTGDAAEMGPITTRPQFDKVCGYLERARADGLDCVTGGAAIEGGGNYVAPTIFRNVPHDNAIWVEEVFGPVLVTTTATSDDEAITLANLTEYGLVGSVISGDWERAKRIADRIEAGQIWINTPQIVYPDSAWGGFKASGIGRELGPWGLSGYQGVKHILSPRSKPLRN